MADGASPTIFIWEGKKLRHQEHGNAMRGFFPADTLAQKSAQGRFYTGGSFFGEALFQGAGI